MKRHGKHIEKDSSISYYKNNKLHRKYGPAVIRDSGSKFWCQNGEYHREAGPAIEWCDSEREWYYYGHRAKDEQEFYNEKWRKGVLMDLV